VETASAESIRKHVRVYVTVFVALMALTLITVTISTLHLETHVAIIVALAIAALKGSLVAAYFMHLINAKRVIYAALALTAVLFLVLMLLPVSHFADRGL
jgi:cytochrome c oxidase subunit IV